MKALVIYDSVFGNTQKIAQAIGSALGTETVVLPVGEVRPEHLAGLGLLVAGSPTRGFRPTEGTTKFLKSLPENSLQGVKVTAFDTRVDIRVVNSKVLTFMVNLFGYAAAPIAKALQKKGGELVCPPEGFIVLDREGPLKEGELERAASWARALGVKEHFVI